MGIVYKALDKKLDRTVALKFLPPELTNDAEAKERFIVEAKSASALDHPNICTIHEIGETKHGQLYIAMGCYEGATLQQKIRTSVESAGQTGSSSAPLSTDRLKSLEEIIDIAIQIAQGLVSAHAKGIIHRDIKPANVMITKSGMVKILDFGLAKLAHRSGITKTGSTPGTIAYMSPEQIRGEENDHRTDLWSLGVVLYEMVAGRLPFNGECDAAILYAIVNLQPESVKKFRPDVSAQLAGVIDRALQKDPRDRYQTAEEFIQALQACRPSDAVLPSGALKKNKRPGVSKKRKILVGIAALFCLFMLFFLAPHWHSVKKTTVANTEKVFAIFPFNVRGAPDYSYLDEGMMDLLYTNLNSAGDLRSVDPRAVLNQIKLLRKREVTIEEAENIARFFGAGYFILGSLFAAEGRLRFSATLYDLSAKDNRSIPLSAESPAKRPFELVDDVSLQVLSRYSKSLAARNDLLENKTTRSLPALKAYLEGLKADRHGLFEDAHALYSQAVQYDSSFALAWFRRSLVNYGFLTNTEEAKSDLNRALHSSAKISEHDRLLMQAHQASISGECERAMSEYRQIVARYPDDIFGWENLAFNWLQWANFFGHSIRESYPLFEKLLSLDPENGGYYQQMLVPAIKRGDRAEIDSIIAKLQRFSPDHTWAWAAIAPRAFLDDDSAMQKKIIQQAPSQDDVLLHCGIENSAVNASRLSSVMPLARTLLHPSRSEKAQTYGYLYLAVFDLGLGKWQAATGKLDSMNRYRRGYGRLFRSLFSPFLLFHAPTADPSVELQAMEKWRVDRRPLPGATDWDLKQVPEYITPIQLYTLGLLNHFRGDSSRTLSLSQQLLKEPSPIEAGSLLRIWAGTLQALEAMRQNHP
ncbi:MAG TPA: protein kinase, partial [bacterium]|nr:protein kinase [bacterium]